MDNVESNLQSNTSLAQVLADEVNRLIYERNELEYKPRLLNLQAHLDIFASEYEQAFERASEAEILTSIDNNLLQHAEAIRRKGIIKYLMQFDFEAIELLNISLSYHRSINSKYVLNNLQSLGNVYQSNDVWSERLIDTGEALVEESIARKDEYFLVDGYGFIVSGLIKQGDIEEAASVLNKARSVLTSEQFQLYYYESELNLKQGKLREAMIAVEKYNQWASDYPLIVVIAGQLLKYDILLEMGNKDEAITVLLQAHFNAEKLNFDEYSQEVLFKLSNFYEMEGDFKNAMDFHKQYAVLSESALEKSKSEQLSFSRLELKIQQKNQEINELRLLQQLTEQENEYKSYIIFLCVIMLMLIGIYTYRMIKQKRVLDISSNELEKAKIELEETNRQLFELARTDELTSLPNRRFFNEFLNYEWKRLSRTGGELSILLIDIDHFKMYNDTYGHADGDKCIKKVADVLRESVQRPTDLIARYGGEEFICVLVDTHHEGALQVANEIQQNIENTAIPHKASPLKNYVTLSIGVATCTPKENGLPYQLISVADNCLYDAKNAGRNQICSSNIYGSVN